MPIVFPIRLPTFSAWLSGALISTRMSGFAESTRFADLPAASRMSPLGAVMTPVFSTFGATRKILPPLAALIDPWLTMLPAFAIAVKLLRPAAKSAFERFNVEATSPPTSIREPPPNTMPLGLSKNTRPFDCKEPRMADGSPPTTRLSTALAVVCWMNRVTSFWPMPKLCQLMTAPGVLVTVSVLPLEPNVAPPLTTTPPVGMASTVDVKHDATARASALARHGIRCNISIFATTGPRDSKNDAPARGQSPAAGASWLIDYFTTIVKNPTACRSIRSVGDKHHGRFGD